MAPEVLLFCLIFFSMTDKEELLQLLQLLCKSLIFKGIHNLFLVFLKIVEWDNYVLALGDNYFALLLDLEK